MTRKDYVAIAAALNHSRIEGHGLNSASIKYIREQWEMTRDRIADHFAADNLSYCALCGEFVSMTLQLRQWTVSKFKDGAQAGKWALVNPAGHVFAIYPIKSAAVKDCALHNGAKS